MIILLPLLRLLGIRSRFATCVVLTVATALLIVFALNVLLHSVVVMLVAVMIIAAARRGRRPRRTTV